MSPVPPPPGGGAAQPPPGGAAPSPPQSRNWAMAAHLSAFGALIVPLPFLGPLIVWLIRREVDPYAGAHALEALNFNLTVTIATIVAIVLAFVLIGLLLLPVIVIVWIVFVVVAAVKAANGEPYRYPMTIRFVS